VTVSSCKVTRTQEKPNEVFRRQNDGKRTMNGSIQTSSRRLYTLCVTLDESEGGMITTHMHFSRRNDAPRSQMKFFPKNKHNKPPKM